LKQEIGMTNTEARSNLFSLIYPLGLYSHNKGCTNPGRQVAMATKFWMVRPNICGFSVRNLLHVTLLAPVIFIWLLEFWKIP
jgi:hypothetical protein